MGLLVSEHEKARKKIAMLDMGNYIKKAKELFGLDDSQVETAEREYRHFLYLLYWNRRESNKLPVVPTKRADTLWHAHLLFNAEYNAFCVELYAEIIAHRPGLEEGTDPFIAAVLHTKGLHDRVGYNGFDNGYFSYVERERSSDKKGDTGPGTHAAGGCGGGTNSKATTADTDGGAGSCGSSCGGGGCGGGCGG